MLHLWDGGHFARNCGMISKCEGNGGDGGMGYAKGKGKTMKDTAKKCSGNFGGPKGHSGELKRLGIPRAVLGRAARSDTSRQSVDGESFASMRKMETAEKAEDNLNLKKIEKSEECGSSGTWRSSRWTKAPAIPGADPSAGQVKIDVMNSV